MQPILEIAYLTMRSSSKKSPYISNIQIQRE